MREVSGLALTSKWWLVSAFQKKATEFFPQRRTSGARGERKGWAISFSIKQPPWLFFFFFSPRGAAYKEFSAAWDPMGHNLAPLFCPLQGCATLPAAAQV